MSVPTHRGEFVPNLSYYLYPSFLSQSTYVAYLATLAWVVLRCHFPILSYSFGAKLDRYCCSGPKNLSK